MCLVVGVWMRVSAVRMVRNEARESIGATGGSDMWGKSTQEYPDFFSSTNVEAGILNEV